MIGEPFRCERTVALVAGHVAFLILIQISAFLTLPFPFPLPTLQGRTKHRAAEVQARPERNVPPITSSLLLLLLSIVDRRVCGGNGAGLDLFTTNTNGWINPACFLLGGCQTIEGSPGMETTCHAQLASRKAPATIPCSLGPQETLSIDDP